MACPSCGADNPITDRFCGQCGSALPAACAACGRANPASNRFCGGCGAPLGDAAPTGAPDPERPAATPRDRIPRHLAEKILANRAALEGERKQVTVLFADIVGSTELIRDRDPEEAQRLLDGAVQRMMEAVHRYEGTVSRLLGDGLMAMFGAPVAHEDHAVRACFAALAMVEAVREYADEARRAHGADIQVRVGINSGEVVVRLISDDLHMDYTAMGQTVHLAARMEQAAAPGGILTTVDTVRLVEGYVEARPLGPVPVKGLDEPVEAFEVLGTGAARTRLDAAASRGLTPFVGRHVEIAAVEAALARAREGHGHVVALVGEPGVGKSRIVREVARSERLDGWSVLEADALSHGTSTPYLPVIDLVEAICGIGGDDAEARREKVRDVLRARGLPEPTALPAILSVLGVRDDEAAWEALDPPVRRQRTLDALRHLLLAESRRRPLLLIVEDLHWVDEQTQALLDGLADGLASARIVLLVTYRPEYRHGWGGKTYYTQLSVEPLPGEGAADLLDALLGGDPSLAALKRLLIERTGGNPFFLEESVRSLIEIGALVGERGGHRLVADLPAIRMPATVQAVLAARIDRLAPEDKRLLQTAAVVGATVPLGLLREVADAPTDVVQAGLERLRAAELLYEASLFPEPDYTFKHALTHEVAYGGLLREHRRALHGRALEAIERQYRDRLDEYAERLTLHAMRAGAWAKATDHGGRAGRKATFRSANREAVMHFEQALEALGHLPESRGNLEVAVDLRLDLRRALMPLAEQERIIHVLGEAEMRAEALGDQYRVGRVAVLRANSYWWAGNHRMAVEGGQRALAAANAVGAIPLQLEARQVLAHAYSSLGDYVRAADGLRANLDALADDPLRRPLGLASYPAVDAGAYLAWCLAHLGHYAEAIAVGERAVRHAEETRSPYDQSRALGLVAAAYLHRGSIATATAMLHRSADLCKTWGLAVNVRLDAIHLGTAYTMAGRPEDGLPLLEHAADAPIYRARLHVQALALAALSAGYLAVGRVEDAAKRATQALDAAASQGEKSHEAYARHVLGVIAARRTPPAADEAEARYREALGQAEDLRMRPLQAHCHLGLGNLYRRAGRLDDAHAELSTAVDMLREMGMAFWLPEAEAELAGASR